MGNETDPACAEILAQAGFDFVFIDTEHTVLDPYLLQGLLMAFDGTDTVPIVRVASHDPALIKRMLDLGAGGIIVPMVNDAQQAKAAVAACKYPPPGNSQHRSSASQQLWPRQGRVLANSQRLAHNRHVGGTPEGDRQHR